MTPYLLDTNILLRAVQPQSPQYSRAIEAVVQILAHGDNLFITTLGLTQKYE